MRHTFLIALLVYPVMLPAASAEGIGALAGLWRTARHSALVEITDCGDATPCGALAWASEAVFEGNTQDIRNRNLALRERPLLGVPILWGFQRRETGWQSGRIYNPEDGKTFRANLQQLSKDELRVQGCLGPLCRSQIWTRSTTN
ncbi:MAG: DUF2147 domain-containing protein [Rhodobacteraceae bacterium]|nr:DUF2147 domain-containing protein [Paracoccaceae bacterium]